MPISVTCDRCVQELMAPGALVFSPPQTTAKGISFTRKIHLCVECWLEFVVWKGTSKRATATFLGRKWPLCKSCRKTPVVTSGYCGHCYAAMIAKLEKESRKRAKKGKKEIRYAKGR